MPTFRFKNLAVTILPEEAKAPQLGLLFGYGCVRGSCYLMPRCFDCSCSYQSSCNDTRYPFQAPCDDTRYPMGWPFSELPRLPPGGVFDPYIKAITSKITAPEELAALKADLQAALAEIDRQEKVVAAAGKPQTLEEAEKLEAALKQALQEVETFKKELK